MWQTKGWPARSAAGKGDAALSRHIGASLMADEFDMSFFMNKKLDHGLFSPLGAAAVAAGDGWPTR
jgi:gallate dioxygenase